MKRENGIEVSRLLKYYEYVCMYDLTSKILDKPKPLLSKRNYLLIG